MSNTRDWQGRLARCYGGLRIHQVNADDFVIIGCGRGFLLVTFVVDLGRFITFHVDRLDFPSILQSKSSPRFRPMGIAKTYDELLADIDYNVETLLCG